MVRTLVLLWLISLPVLFVLYRNLDPSPDQAIFDYIAWLNSQGLAPYRDTFEVNWPGAVLVHIAAQSLFGPVPEAIRSFDYVIVQATALAGACMLWRQTCRVGAALFLALFPLLYVASVYWMTGQRDILAGECLLLACLLAGSKGRTALGLAAAGFLIGFAIVLRPTYLAFLGGALLVELVWPGSFATRVRGACAILSGAIALLLVLVAVGLGSGTLAPWYEASVQFAIRCYASVPAPLPMTSVAFELFTSSWRWITPLAAAGLLAWTNRAQLDRRQLVLVVGAIATSLLSFVVQKKGWGYHLGGAFPFLVLLLAVFVDTLARRSLWFGQLPVEQRGTRAAALSYLVAFVAVLGLIGAGSMVKLAHVVEPNDSAGLPFMMKVPDEQNCESGPTARAAAAMLVKLVPPGARVLTVNCGYRAAYLAKRVPTSRLATSTSFDVRNQSCQIADRLQNAYVDDFRRFPPAAILVSAKKFDSRASQLAALPAATPTELRLAAMASKYRRVFHVGNLMIYVPGSS